MTEDVITVAFGGDPEFLQPDEVMGNTASDVAF